jgi:hypothetical protein
MIWNSGFSIVVHLLINSYFFAKRKVVAWLGLAPRLAQRRLMKPNIGSFLIVGLVFFGVTASSSILTTSIFKNGGYNLVFIGAEISSLRKAGAPAAIASRDNTKPSPNPKINGAPRNQARLAVADPVQTGNPPPLFSETVLPGEGFWEPASRLVREITVDPCRNVSPKSARCAGIERSLDILTASLLVRNGVIKNNFELRIAHSGSVLTIDSLDNLYIDGIPTIEAGT